MTIFLLQIPSWIQQWKNFKIGQFSLNVEAYANVMHKCRVACLTHTLLAKFYNKLEYNNKILYVK